MIETFKQIISSILFIGIFIAILDLIVPKSKNKRYIYVIAGIVIIITVITPINNLLNLGEIDFEDFFNGFETQSVLNNVENVNLIKEEFTKNFKKDIKEKLYEKGISVKDVYIDVNDKYEILNIKINIEKMQDREIFDGVTEIVKYITSEYDVDYSKIEVIEEG